MPQMTAAEFGDAVVDAMLTPAFDQLPVLRPALAFAAAWTFQRMAAGQYGMIAALPHGSFVNHAIDVTRNLVLPGLHEFSLDRVWSIELEAAYKVALRDCFLELVA